MNRAAGLLWLAVEDVEPAAIVCGQPAVAVVTAGCVHEHVDTGPVCAACLDRMIHGRAWLCGACEDSHGPCAVMVTQRPVAEA